MEEPGAELVMCERVGEPMADIAGIGILVAFAGQAFLTLALAIWVVLLSKWGRLGVQHEQGTIDDQLDTKRAQLVSEILMVGNGLQVALGLALIATGFTQARNLDLYHLQLIYDTASFVGISNCAAIVTENYLRDMFPLHSGGTRRSARVHRVSKFMAHRRTLIFAVAMLVLVVFLEIRLNEWDLASPELGHCFITTGTFPSGAAQPGAVKAYVGITAVWLMFTIFGTIVASGRWRKTLLAMALLQFPLHLYYMIQVKLSNQHRLEGEEGENAWDFGQTTSVVLLGGAVFELVGKAFEYYHFDKDVKDGAAHAELKPRAYPLQQMALLDSREQDDVEGGRQ